MQSSSREDRHQNHSHQQLVSCCQDLNRCYYYYIQYDCGFRNNIEIYAEIIVNMSALYN